MHITKAVITAAGRNQRTLPMQTLTDRDGAEKSVLAILVEEAISAGVDEIAIVVAPGDEGPYAAAVGDHAGRLHFVPQNDPRGYGHAIYCAKAFTGNEPFLHLVGDHLYVSGDTRSCAQQLVAVAETEDCAVSAVQATRENLLPYYGTVGGKRVSGRKDLYEIDTVIEKPTPTEAELRLIVPGLRAGHYLCFFGMHVLTPAVMEILESRISKPANQRVTLSEALAVLATREKYLALEERALRYDVGVKYGLLVAQLALALSGDDRDEVLARLVELLASRELRRGA
ncbi:MAG: NTP transferase domain-containing protein [Anaerolineae bacterium]|nr:NTP transferase domain-containing protein [Anaerolineae bacterium]